MTMTATDLHSRIRTLMPQARADLAALVAHLHAVTPWHAHVQIEREAAIEYLVGAAKIFEAGK